MIFETDVLIWCFRGNRRALEMIGSELERALSIVSFMELLQGARSLAEIREIRRFLRNNMFRTLPLDEASSHVAASLVEAHALRCGLPVADALIAATARETGEILATGNIRHFRPIAGLRLKTVQMLRERAPKTKAGLPAQLTLLLPCAGSKQFNGPRLTHPGGTPSRKG